ncbi:MAG: tRNA (N6-isopentenyl adenosine(37)-C2)-methylthiotransferase MiaB [Alphaproteobacteria bacterium]
MTPTPKKLLIKTYGCQMNVYDTARIRDVLTPLGYVPTDKEKYADLVIFNTCHIREKAAEKLYSDLGRIRPLKEQRAAAGRPLLIAVAGCVAQAEGEEVMRRAPYVDIVFGTQTYHRLPQMIAEIFRKEGKDLLDTDFPVEEKFDFLPKENASQGVSAYLAVQEGCDKFCTYCVVPYTRGAEYSRSVQAVLEEARSLLRAGAKEITLVGQNINTYHGVGKGGKEVNLAALLYELAALEGVERLRYITSYPSEVDSDLIQAHGAIPQLMPFLHLPIQSGSDPILKEMGRKYTAEQYLKLVDALRHVRPDIAISSDFIIGFPGETDAHHAETMRLIEKIGFASAYSFKYSRRPGTPASIMKKQIDEKLKGARLAELQDLLNQQQEAFNTGFIGKTVPVLFDRAGKKENQLIGRSPHMQAVYAIADKDLQGQVVDVNITNVSHKSLTGDLA